MLLGHPVKVELVISRGGAYHMMFESHRSSPFKIASEASYL